ncbi:hypothetical protein J5N97_019883 [Dioscorea zingiberensis]|uniref:Seipin n=1 Tax=Dioscorea zingiberensis TaxID=325984 RepID=A0A9D5CFI9_9LILI|nr:hypothetical protein J5N97_019883 [Dioscorea zingiberensis]
MGALPSSVPHSSVMDRRSRPAIAPRKDDHQQKLSVDHHQRSPPAAWLLDLVDSQVDLITTLLFPLISPLFTVLSEPHSAASRARALLRRLILGLLGAFYAGAVLLAVAAAAAVLGLVLVKLWTDEPVIMREPLYFDYTEPHPSAMVSLSAGKGRAVPAGHSVRASLQFLMPDSDYNIHVGIFQVTAEALSSKGNIIATSSQPCMLRFRSLPVRLMHTFLMGVPLLLGMSTESQETRVDILRYKEIWIQPIDRPTEPATGQSYMLRDGEHTDDALYDKLRKWRQKQRIKRKAQVLNKCLPEPVEGYSSSTVGESSEAVNDSGEFAASESSVCTGS